MAVVHRFDDLELDESLYQLRQRGAVVRVEPKVFDLLLYLVRNRARVVTKEELLDHLWPGASSDAVISRYVADARKAVGDSAHEQRCIKTVHGRGYRFVAATSEPSPSAAEPTREPTPDAGAGIFVGRDRAMKRLEASMEEVLSGRGRLVLIAGEPGIGKTRTAFELASRARARGLGVLAGRCHEGGGAPPFWPWVQILRAAVGTGGSSALASLGPAAADVARVLPGASPATADALAQLAPEQARFRLFDGITVFLQQRARRGPVMVLLDDLHWADSASLLLLRFLAREMRDTRLLVVGTYRDIEVDRKHPLAGVLGALAREPVHRRVTLRGLERDEVARYMGRRASVPVSEGLVSTVYRMTAGNPFFLEGVVRLLEADGRLDDREESSEPIGLPEGVRDAIGRRLGTLSAECNEVLSAAAVIGTSFTTPILERALNMSGDRLVEILDPAVHEHLVEVSGPRFDFSHGLIRETLYEELSVPKRVRLHRLIGGVLEDAYRANPGPHLAEIAHHYFEAAPGGDASKAATFSLRAAERANQLLSYEEAAVHYGRAIEAIELGGPVDEAVLCSALLGLGTAQVNSGDRELGRATFTRAAAVARSAARPDLLARATLGFGGPFDYFGMPADEPLRSLLEEALESLGNTGDAGLRAGLLARLASTPPHSESMTARDELSRQAVELARQTTDPAMLARTLGARFWALLGPDHVTERLSIGGELQALARRTGDPNYAVLAHEYRFGCWLGLGDVGAADRELESLSALAERLRRPVDRWLVRWFSAGRALSDGRFDEAQALMDAALEAGRRAEHPGAAVVFGGQTLWLAHERGYEGAFSIGIKSFEEDYPWAERIEPVGVAYAHSEAGRIDAARRAFDRIAEEGFDAIPRDEHWMVVMALLATVCATVGDVARAEQLSSQLAPYHDRVAVHDLLRIHAGSVALYLALLASTRARWDEAARYFETAVALNERIGSRPYVARAKHQYAKMLGDRGDGRDRARARRLNQEALQAAETMGMGHVAAAARSLASKLGSG